MELVFVSICDNANWDQLYGRVVQVAQASFDAIRPSALSDLSADAFASTFGAGLEGRPLRAAQRVATLTALGRLGGSQRFMDRAPWSRRGPVPIGGPDGLYAWLDEIPALAEDPLRKKARVFVHQLLKYELIDPADAVHILPAIDHHIMRLYVRTGRVLPVRAEGWQRLDQSRTARIEYLTDLRLQVEEAMLLTAAGSGHRVDVVNHIEWQVARSFCVRAGARCQEGPLPEKPIDDHVRALSPSQECPMYSCCLGASLPLLRALVEPAAARGRSFY